VSNVAIKKPLYNFIAGAPEDRLESNDQQSLGNQLVPYDTGYGVVRFFPKRALDRVMLEQLPQMLTTACLQGNELAARIGPKMIRVADQYTWGLIYLSGRNQYLKAVK
jgi:hypothetical protein